MILGHNVTYLLPADSNGLLTPLYGGEFIMDEGCCDLGTW